MSAQINEAYQYLLTHFKLDHKHLTNLENRGFNAEQIVALGYKSLPIRRKPTIEKMVKEVEPDGVPGLWKNENNKWQLAGKAGMLIPVRGHDGTIISMKIRSDDSDGIGKYLQLSSNPKKLDSAGKPKYPHGTAATIAVHYPIVGKMDKVLRITEGELKADIATIMSGTYTISIPGIAMWQWALEAVENLKPEKILIAFDSDKNKEFSTSTGKSDKDTDPFQVAKALSNLYAALKEKGANVVIEDWKEGAGKGIDDVFSSGKEDEIKELSDEEAKEFVDNAMRKDMPLGWVYIIGTKRFINFDTLQELDKEQFSDKYAPEYKKEKAADKALRQAAFPKADLPTYEPGKATVIDDGKMKLFNIWKKGPLEPQKGAVKPFIEHAEYILPLEYERNIMFDYLAHIIQKPGFKIHWAILLQSVPGAGKSYFGNVMRLCLGKDNVAFPSNEAIHEAYTGWQKSCQLIVIEELMARGRMELMNKLKPMITQPIANIREMYKPPYEQPNRFNMLMFTNHEDAIIIDETDRRYCVLFSPAEPKEPKYYEKLWEWTDANAGKILNWLEKRDISAFKPYGHAPMTTSKTEMIAESAPPLYKWVKDCIDTESWPFNTDLVGIHHLTECMPKHLRFATPNQLTKVLRKLGVRELRPVKMTIGNHVRLLSVRRHEIWASAKDSALVAHYEREGLTGNLAANPILESRPF